MATPTFEQVFPVLYKGWDQPSAKQDYLAGGWKNKAGAEQFTGGTTTGSSETSGGSVLDQVNSLIENSYNTLLSEAISKFGEYQSSNPFNLDEVLAAKTTEAAEQIDPYYNETITNYLTGVTNKIQRSKEDAQLVLDELNTQATNFTQRTGASLAKAVESAKQGFADTGLLSSGAALGTQGETTVTSNESLSDYLRTNTLNQKKTNLELSRGLTDIGLEKSQTVRDIERQRYTDVQTRAGELAKEAAQEYATGFQQTLPTELQAASGFDILQNLGVYS
jgi:hypothetical protein